MIRWIKYTLIPWLRGDDDIADTVETVKRIRTIVIQSRKHFACDMDDLILFLQVMPRNMPQDFHLDYASKTLYFNPRVRRADDDEIRGTVWGLIARVSWMREVDKNFS